MPSGSLRAFGNGGRLVRRSLPSGVLLPRVVLQPQGVRVWIMDSFLRRGVRGADECNGRVVCHRGRRVDSERTGGVLGGGGRWKWWRWGLHASCGDVDCGGVPRTHCGLERDGGCIWGVRRQWHKRRGGGFRCSYSFDPHAHYSRATPLRYLHAPRARPPVHRRFS